MTKLYGREWSEQELRQRTGLIEQLGGVELGELADGAGRGVRTARLRTGAGLDVTVLIDRGMDLYDAQYRGLPLAWVSPTGPVHPAYYDPRGLEWLRGFYGGLMLTCGMSTIGAPSVDQGVELGLHGRVSNLPASNIHAGGMWQGGHYVMFVEGQVRETSVFGENFNLTRRIEARLGEARLAVHDIVTNDGYQSSPHMFLYHVNAGFPVVDDGSRLIAPSAKITPRDDDAAAGVGDCTRFTSPIVGFREQVYFHELAASADGTVTVALANPMLEQQSALGFYIRYPLRELPCLNQWKMMGASIYSVGLEPATNWVDGRARERERGNLKYLEPGEQRQYHLEFGIVASLEEVLELEDRAQGLVASEKAI